MSLCFLCLAYITSSKSNQLLYQHIKVNQSNNLNNKIWHLPPAIQSLSQSHMEGRQTGV